MAFVVTQPCSPSRIRIGPLQHKFVYTKQADGELYKCERGIVFNAENKLYIYQDTDLPKLLTNASAPLVAK